MTEYYRHKSDKKVKLGSQNNDDYVPQDVIKASKSHQTSWTKQNNQKKE